MNMLIKIIRTGLHYCKRCVICIIRFIISSVPKDRNLVLFSAWFGQKYADSSKFMFEYLLANSNYNVYWYTRNMKLYIQLKAQGIPTVYSKTIKSIWKQIRAVMLVSSVQLYDFSPYFLNRCIYFDLGHGFPIKQSGYEQPNTTPRLISYELFLRKNIDYYMEASSYTTMKITSRAFRVAPSHIAFANKARTDVFFNKELREGKNRVVDQLKAGKKAIVYMPTHRSCGSIPIKVNEIIDLIKIQIICERHDAVFLIKKHYYHRNEIESLYDYSNIFDITCDDVETQTLLYQADILISDYSACYIDYLLLDKPIIFHAYDLEVFQKTEREMYFKFDDNDAGYKSKTKEELCDVLEKVCTTWKDEEHAKGREEVRIKYFDCDVPLGNAREEIKQIMGMIIANEYVPKWGRTRM